MLLKPRSQMTDKSDTESNKMANLPFALGHELSVSSVSEGTVEVEDPLDNPNPNNVSVPVRFSLHLPAITCLLTSPR